MRLRRPASAGRAALWEARFTFLDPEAPTGRRQLSLYGASRKEVEDKLVEALAAKQRGIPVTRPGTTVREFLEAWIDRKAATLKPATVARYRYMVDKVLIPGVGHHKVNRLTPRHIETLTSAAIARGGSARTANHIRAVLRTALNDAVRQGLVTTNAAVLAMPRRVDDRPVEPMRPEEAAAILEACAGHWVEGPVAVSLWAGLRLGEVLALTWDRVDLDARELRVAASLTRLQGRTTIATTKTRASTRIVPLAEPLRDILLVHREAGRRARRAAGDDWDASWGDLVFSNGAGDPLHPSTVAHTFQKRLSAAGLAPRRFHDLRHGAATLWLASGADIKTVSTLLGHASIAITANTYTGVLDTLRRDAVDRMALLMGSSMVRRPGQEL